MSIDAQGAERAILSILMKEPERFFDVSDILTESDFVNTGAGLTFSIIRDLIISGQTTRIDKHLIFTIADQKNLDGFYHFTLNGELIDAIETQNVNPANFFAFIKAVKQAAIKRALINTCENLKSDIEEHGGDTTELRNLVETRVLNSVRALDSGDDGIQCLDQDFEETIHNFADLNGQMGIDVGFPRWQEDIGYVRNGAITGVFASTKVGKSQFSMWCAYMTSVVNRLPTLYLDTELQLRQQQMRLCSIITGIPFNVLEKGTWKSDREAIAKIDKACKLIKGAPMYYKNIAGKSVHNVIPIIRKFTYQQLGGPVEGDEGRGLCIYDYIKLMDAADIDRMQEYQLIGILMSSLHDCAVHLNIPILALGQLNKQEDIGIRRIVENVDSASILRPKKKEEIAEDGLQRGSHAIEARWARHGPGHNFNEWVNVHFDKSCGQFKEDKRNSEVMSAVQRVKAQLLDSESENIMSLKE